MTKTVVFVHGAFVTGLCWEKFTEAFAAADWTCHAPSWPHLDGEPAALRKAPPAELAALGIEEILDHYAAFIEALPEPPMLVGHSFGGLFVQLLLQRGLGRAGVAIDPAPPSGVLPSVQALKAAWPVVGTFGHWKKTIDMSVEEFGATFANGLEDSEKAAAWDRYVVPSPGRLWAQSTFRPGLVKIDFSRADRAPLMIFAGSADRTVTPDMNRKNFEKYGASSAVTEFHEFEGRSHFLIAEPGWEEVASKAMDFLDAS